MVTNTQQDHDTFTVNVDRHRDAIIQTGMALYEKRKQGNCLGDSEHFDFQFDDGTYATIELWVCDDVIVRLLAYHQYDADDGFSDTNLDVFRSIGDIGYEEAFVGNYE
jgi:hypothetical protein